VRMSDIPHGNVSPDDFQGLAACGGFSNVPSPSGRRTE
jgi:phosphoribosylformylglycinamidine (FGAM) synthase-like amidotransferase family enzyme